MTKDEAIEVTRGDFEREYASLFLDESTMHYLVRNSNGEYGYGEVEQCWLMWSRGIAQAPTSEAVAEKPQDDRNAASPAATDEQQGNAIRPLAEPAGQHSVPQLLCSKCGADRMKQPCGSLSDCALIGIAQAVPLAVDQPAGAAKGGITMNALREWENMPWAKAGAAQPAADPAPVPAQGIDHAKLAEDERAAFEAWKARGLEERVARGLLLKNASGSYQVLCIQQDWTVWQARGQQAGVPEGCVIVPKEPTEAMIRAACLNQAIGDYADYDAWWNSHSSGISEKIRDYVASDYRAMIAAAAAPGEAGS